MRIVQVILALFMLAGEVRAAQRADGQLRLEIVDSKTGQPMAVRMRLKNARGRPVVLRLPGTAEFGGHFYIDGQVTLLLSVGHYTFELDAPPDYKPDPPSGRFEIVRNADDTKRIEMTRFANMNEEGWWAGDLDVARRAEDLPLIMRAEGLSVVPARAPAARPASAAGRLGRAARAEITATPFAQLAKQQGGELMLFGAAGGAAAPRIRVARTPFAWDLPVWLSRGELDAIGLIHHHALDVGVVDNEGDGRARDRSLYFGKSGNARWSEAIYHHVLNCGLRMPPAAGSGSGANNSPVGTNRLYVYCGDEFSPARWWAGLAAGRVFVTNGPLMRALVQGHPPGYVFRIDEGENVSFEIGLNLAMRSPMDYLQIVKNGQPYAEVRLDEWKNKVGRLPPVEFDDSGWFLVRGVTTNDRKYEQASTGPYYVEKGGRARISRRSVQFFLDWIAAASDRIRKLPDVDEAARSAMLAEQAGAREFFEGLMAKANAE
ncbi:MAG: hypothetical protein WD669_06885 [Pirellulales bacterium]